MLRGKAIFDRSDQAARLIDKIPAHGIVCIDVFQNPSAAMEKQEHAAALLFMRPI